MEREFRSILVGLVPASYEGDAAPTPGFHYGLGLARRFAAGLTIEVFIPRLVVPYTLVGGLARSLVGEENVRRRALAAALAQNAARLAEEAAVSHIEDAPDLVHDKLVEHFAQLARVRDIAVFDAHEGVLGSNRHLIEETLFNGGRPVIVVPQNGGNPAPRRILIAWDGSGRSARAVVDALPLLQRAEAVSVVVVAGEKDLSGAASGEALRGHLNAHGVEAELVTLEAIDGDVAETLRRHVPTMTAELVVMGAFVHSRFRQTVLGGVTQSLLDKSPVPLLLAY